MTDSGPDRPGAIATPVGTASHARRPDSARASLPCARRDSTRAARALPDAGRTPRRVSRRRLVMGQARGPVVGRVRRQQGPVARVSARARRRGRHRADAWRRWAPRTCWRLRCTPRGSARRRLPFAGGTTCTRPREEVADASSRRSAREIDHGVELRDRNAAAAAPSPNATTRTTSRSAAARR